MCVDSQELIMEDISQNEMNINDLMHKIGLLKDNAMVPITLFYTKMNTYDQKKLKIISSRILNRFPKGIIKTQYFVPVATENSGCSEKTMIMFENFIDHCIEQKVLKEI